ncbi:hypothetical protein NliqN6_6312 [Naganishia liquefaciens]|uniref:Nuclear movement protein nudC n=1 Tax=Naganishia liquefaciens TaxID=104408 RepID=A0A8H3TZV4_9TREE|nr:hypothetical protein NliqN6_6312 [Naganishia liquefaciens]
MSALEANSKSYDEMSKPEQGEHDRAARAKEQAEQDALPYKWTQYLNTATVTVNLPSGTRARDLVVAIKKKSIKVQIKSQSEPILEGELFAEIKEEDSTWSIDEGVLYVELEKLSSRTSTPQWWPHILTHHPRIDTTKLAPENSKLSDLDGETRGMVEKMMFDNQQKQAGKPTSDEQRKLDMLEKFKKAHPEMDFSNAKVG